MSEDEVPLSGPELTRGVASADIAEGATLLGLGADRRPDLGDLETGHHFTSKGSGAGPRSDSR